MGCINSNGEQPITNKQKTFGQIVVATLNYCGIMNSPFQFYCEDYLQQLKDISRQFINVLPLYFEDWKTKPVFQFGKLDVKYRTRYSPMFILKAGIENNKFITRQEFEKKWEEKFKEDIPKVKVPYKQQQKEVMKKYDIAMFHCLLRYVYGINQLKQAANKKVDDYIKKLGPFYELSFLDEQKKCKKVMSNLEKIKADVFFFQEYSENFYVKVKETDKYHIVNDDSKDTLILARKKSFQGVPENKDVFWKKNNIQEDLWTKLNCAERTSIMIIDKYVLLCAHLTSKAEKNLPQIKDLREALQTLKSSAPDYDIILGGDLNSFWKPQGQKLSIYPKQQKDWTTIKKRTATQGQPNKADKIVCQSKDKIISSLQISSGEITYINGEKPHTNNLVPTNQHPFDHFVLVTHIKTRDLQ